MQRRSKSCAGPEERTNEFTKKEPYKGTSNLLKCRNGTPKTPKGTKKDPKLTPRRILESQTDATCIYTAHAMEQKVTDRQKPARGERHRGSLPIKGMGLETTLH